MRLARAAALLLCFATPAAGQTMLDQQQRLLRNLRITISVSTPMTDSEGPVIPRSVM